MNEDLAVLQDRAGARWTELAGRRVVESYDDDSGAALRAARESVALMDRSHWGRIMVAGNDRRRFLHNMTTADFNALADGAVLDAVLVTSTARVVDYVTAYARPEGILLVTSPERRRIVPQWLGRFIFFNDDVQVVDLTDQGAMFSLYGPASASLLQRLGLDAAALRSGEWLAATLTGVEVMVAAGSELRIEGYTLIVDGAGAAAIWRALTEHGQSLGLELLGEAGWEQLRVAEGRPRADRELTEEHNPLEAGLWDAVSFRKGCYIGQEVIARLDTYQKVKHRLMRVRLSAPAEVGAPVRVGNEEVGALTSVAITEEGPVGLAYVRSKAAQPAQPVEVDATSGELLEAPYLRWGRADLPGADAA